MATWESDPSEAVEDIPDIIKRLKRDPIYGADIATRLNAASKAEWRFVPTDEADADARLLTERMIDAWWRIPRLTTLYERILGSRIWGPAFEQIRWGTVVLSDSVVNIIVDHRHEESTDRIRWHDKYGWMYTGNQMGWTVGMPGHPLDSRFVDDDKFQGEHNQAFPYGSVAVFVNDQTIQDPWGWAIVEGLRWCYKGKKEGIESMMDWMRNFSGPAQVGYVKDKSQRSNMINMMMNQRRGIKYVLSEDEKMEFVSAAAGTTGRTYIEALDYWDRVGTVLTLHQSLATLESQGQTGTYAQAKIHDGVRLELVLDDIQYINDSVNHGTFAVDSDRLPSLLDMFLELNGWQEFKGRVKFEMYIEEAVEDPSAALQLLSQLKQAGVDTKKDDWYDATAGLSTRPDRDAVDNEIIREEEGGGFGFSRAEHKSIFSALLGENFDAVSYLDTLHTPEERALKFVHMANTMVPFLATGPKSGDYYWDAGYQITTDITESIQNAVDTKIARGVEKGADPGAMREQLRSSKPLREEIRGHLYKLVDAQRREDDNNTRR